MRLRDSIASALFLGVMRAALLLPYPQRIAAVMIRRRVSALLAPTGRPS